MVTKMPERAFFLAVNLIEIGIKKMFSAIKKLLNPSVINISKNNSDKGLLLTSAHQATLALRNYLLKKTS